MAGIWGAEYWQVDGIDVETWGVIVVDVEDYLPARIGQNVPVPGRRGERWREKRHGAGGFVLTLAVTDLDETTGVAAATLGERQAQMHANLDDLIALLTPTGRELAFTRRRYVDDDNTETLTGHGEVVAAIPLERSKGGVVRAVVDVAMADPCWYGEEQEDEVEVGVPYVLTNPGNTRAESLTVQFVGPLTNPLLTNTVFDPDVSLGFAGTIDDGDTVVVDVDEFTAVNGAANVIGQITHAGSARWMELVAGPQTLNLTADAGDGSAVVTFDPPHLL